MKLIINVPTDEKGINDFNMAFAKVQAELIKNSIDELNIDKQSKRMVVNELLTTLKKQVYERKMLNEKQ